MQVLFIHGMGRSQISGWPLLRHLRDAGLKTKSFDYFVSWEDFETIKRRLVSTVAVLAKRGEYALVGHSLGGVLLRAAVNCLPQAVSQPRHVFLLGSPQLPSSLAQMLGRNFIYRTLTRDCGQFLGSAQRMAEVGLVSAPTTAIVGVRGLSGERSPFKGELNDGVVSIPEISADWLTDQVRVPVVHTLLPSSKLVSEIILQKLARDTRD